MKKIKTIVLSDSEGILHDVWTRNHEWGQERSKSAFVSGVGFTQNYIIGKVIQEKIADKKLRYSN
jgi:hypothetical protein